LKQWFEAKLDHLAQKSDTAKALRYALRHWDGLTLYLDDGRIEMDELSRFFGDGRANQAAAVSG
jgi:hypothetical protein